MEGGWIEGGRLRRNTLSCILSRQGACSQLDRCGLRGISCPDQEYGHPLCTLSCRVRVTAQRDLVN